MTDFLNTYKGKTVLITGNTGFKGAWLSLWLAHLGARVVGYALTPPSEPNLFDVFSLHQDIDHTTGDICDELSLRSVIQKHKPEIVFHLAAQALVRKSYVDPVETYRTNVLGTAQLLSVIREVHCVRALVNVTSDKCYENKGWVWGYRENDRLGGEDPYSSSKACAELVTQAFQNSFFNKEQFGKSHRTALASVRAGNVIGGGDWADDRLIPDFIRALVSKKDITIRYPQSVRPWQHVFEPLAGYLNLGSKLYEQGAVFNGAWNFGPSEQDLWSVERVVMTLKELWGRGGVQTDSQNPPPEAAFLQLNSTKARQLLGWTPMMDTQQALQQTVAWYKKYYHDQKSEIKLFSLQQLNAYQDLLKR